MKLFFRILLGILALALLAGLVGLLSLYTALPWVSAFTAGLLRQLPWLPLAFSVVLLVCIAACLLAIVLLFSVPGGRRTLVLGRDMGRIEVSSHSIESVVGASLASVHEVKRYHVHLGGDPRPHRLKVYIQAEPRDSSAPLAELGRQVQQQVQQDLAACLSIELRAVTVKLQPLPQGQATRHSKVPRVV